MPKNKRAINPSKEAQQIAKELLPECGLACPNKYHPELLTEANGIMYEMPQNIREVSVQTRAKASQFNAKVKLINSKLETKKAVRILMKNWDSDITNRKSGVAGLDAKTVKALLAKLGYLHTFKWGKPGKPCEPEVKHDIIKTVSPDEYGRIGPQVVRTKDGTGRLKFLRFDKWIKHTDDMNILKDFVTSKGFLQDD